MMYNHREFIHHIVTQLTNLAIANDYRSTARCRLKSATEKARNPLKRVQNATGNPLQRVLQIIRRRIHPMPGMTYLLKNPR